MALWNDLCCFFPGIQQRWFHEPGGGKGVGVHSAAKPDINLRAQPQPRSPSHILSLLNLTASYLPSPSCILTAMTWQWQVLTLYTSKFLALAFFGTLQHPCLRRLSLLSWIPQLTESCASHRQWYMECDETVYWEAPSTRMLKAFSLLFRLPSKCK